MPKDSPEPSIWSTDPRLANDASRLRARKLQTVLPHFRHTVARGPDRDIDGTTLGWRPSHKEVRQPNTSPQWFAGLTETFERGNHLAQNIGLLFEDCDGQCSAEFCCALLEQRRRDSQSAFLSLKILLLIGSVERYMGIQPQIDGSEMLGRHIYILAMLLAREYVR